MKILKQKKKINKNIYTNLPFKILSYSHINKFDKCYYKKNKLIIDSNLKKNFIIPSYNFNKIKYFKNKIHLYYNKKYTFKISELFFKNIINKIKNILLQGKIKTIFGYILPKTFKQKGKYSTIEINTIFGKFKINKNEFLLKKVSDKKFKKILYKYFEGRCFNFYIDKIEKNNNKIKLKLSRKPVLKYLNKKPFKNNATIRSIFLS